MAKAKNNDSGLWFSVMMLALFLLITFGTRIPGFISHVRGIHAKAPASARAVSQPAETASTAEAPTPTIVPAYEKCVQTPGHEISNIKYGLSKQSNILPQQLSVCNTKDQVFTANNAKFEQVKLDKTDFAHITDNPLKHVIVTTPQVTSGMCKDYGVFSPNIKLKAYMPKQFAIIRSATCTKGGDGSPLLYVYTPQGWKLIDNTQGNSSVIHCSVIDTHKVPALFVMLSADATCALPNNHTQDLVTGFIR